MMFKGRNPWMQMPWGEQPQNYTIDPEVGSGGGMSRGGMGHAAPNGYFREQQGMQTGGNQPPLEQQPFDTRGQDYAPAMERGYAPQPMWDEKAQPFQSWADKSFQMPQMDKEFMPQPSWDAKDLQPMDKPTWGAKAIPAPQRQGTFGGFRTQPQSGGLANMFRGGRRF